MGDIMNATSEHFDLRWQIDMDLRSLSTWLRQSKVEPKPNQVTGIVQSLDDAFAVVGQQSPDIRKHFTESHKEYLRMRESALPYLTGYQGQPVNQL